MPKLAGPRLMREIRTIRAMIQLYCASHHQSMGLCHDCQENLDYSLRRTLSCPFGEQKCPCRDCSIHCYRQPWKDDVRRIMIWAGPRMLFRHPWLAICHMLDGWKGRFYPRKMPSGGPEQMLPID